MSWRAEHIRDDAEPTLAWFREQGVRCRVISGDNPVTVGAIAGKVKLTGDRKPVAMDARELPQDVDELARVLENVDVLGRVLPEQKKAIVQALHTQKHVVAMTGDGVNDALAIKEADLGIAMGNAAPATKAVAEVVLVDSKFSHLPDVVARGRQVSRWATRRRRRKRWPKSCSSTRNSRICPTSWRADARSWRTWSASRACS